MPRTYDALMEIDALDDTFLNLMFMDFFKTLLPRQTVLRMMDAYLLEVRK